MKVKEALKELTVTRRLPTNTLIVFSTVFLAMPCIVPPPPGVALLDWVDLLVVLLAYVFYELLTKYSSYFKVLYTDTRLAFDKQSIWLCVNLSGLEEVTMHRARLNVLSRWWCRFFPEHFRACLLRNRPWFQRLFKVKEHLIEIPPETTKLVIDCKEDTFFGTPLDDLYFAMTLRPVNRDVMGDGTVILRLLREEYHRKKNNRALI